MGPIPGLAQEEFRNFGEIAMRVFVVQGYEEISFPSVAEDMFDMRVFGTVNDITCLVR